MSEQEGNSSGPGALKWDADHAQASLEKVFEYTQRYTISVEKWYTQRRQRRARLWARGLRVASLIFATLAGVMPLVTQLVQAMRPNGITDPPWYGQPVWSSVFLAIAGALVLIDKFFGFSTSWIRYASTSLAIARAREEFLLDWEIERASWAGGAPTPDQVKAMLLAAKAAIARADELVKVETEAWKAEFQAALKLVDDTIQAGREQAAAVGGLQVSVTNAENVEGGWRLTVDGGLRSTHAGSSAAITGLAPGLHQVRVDGKVAGRPLSAEAAVAVAASQVATVTIALE